MVETPLAILPLDSDPQVITDWFELYVLASEFYSASFSDLSRTWDKRKNTEDTDFESSASLEQEQFLETIFQTVRDRITCLDECYPFIFSSNDEELIFNKDNLNHGALIYIFCLFLSNHNNQVIFDNNSFFEVSSQVRDLFQACSTWAAAGEVQGHSYSFGFPRPDQTGFLHKLTQIYEHFSDGKVRKSPLPGVSINPKDEQMDVIAWKPRRDKAAGMYYLLGQVATGRNWEDKSVKGAVEPFHRIWFDPQPSSTPTPAMFIPFNVLPTKNESLQERLFVLTNYFGNVYYRYCIPELAKKGLELGASNANLTIERQDDIKNVVSWVQGVIVKLREKCVYA